jgi:hypothetical protein
MLIAIMTILFLGGGGAFGPMLFIDSAMDNAKVAIEDKDKRKEATATLKSMKKRSKAYLKSLKKLSKEMNSEFDEHSANEQEIDATWDSIFEMNSEYSNDLVDMRFELRDQLSRAEWEGLFLQ